MCLRNSDTLCTPLPGWSSGCGPRTVTASFPWALRLGPGWRRVNICSNLPGTWGWQWLEPGERTGFPCLERRRQEPQFPLSVVIQSLSCVWLFVAPWTAAHQASLSITISWSLLKFMSIEPVMSSNHLIRLPPSPAFNLSQHQGLF